MGSALMLPASLPAAVPGAPPASGAIAGAADRQAASQLLVKCLRDSIPHLDDGRSDASTIARGALGVCRQQIVSVFQASGAADPQGMADQAPALGTFEQIATALTLERRVALHSRHRTHGAKALGVRSGLERDPPGLHGGPRPHAAVAKTSLSRGAERPAKPCQHYPYCS